MNIREAILEVVDSVLSKYLNRTITVTEVNETEGLLTGTCELDENIEYHDVLMWVLDGEGTVPAVRIVPKIGSKVLIIPVEGDAIWQAVQFTEVDKVLINSPSVIFNEGSLGGLIQKSKLESELKKELEWIKASRQVIAGSPIPEAGNGANSSFQAALAGAIASKQLPTYDDLVNDKIKQ